MVNWAWFPTGGDWTYIESVVKLYESKAHSVIPFSMHHPNNIHTPYEKYFIENIDYQKLNAEKSLKSGYEILKRTIYSTNSQKQIKSLLGEVNIDLVQLNSITNSITPSIIPIIKKKNIPIVWRILDYKIICPNAYLYTNNKICESCISHKYINCVIKKCKKNSISASIVAALGSYFYYLFPYYKDIDLFSFQSEFTRDMFVKFGYDIKRTHIIENPYECINIQPKYQGQDYILYFGRIEKEKGIYTLLDAMKLIPNVVLKVVGNGTEYENCLKYIATKSIKNVTFLGPKWNKELEPIINNCEFVIVPSEWYEPSPYVVLQSFSYGKPVIAANMGGLNDLIINNENGILFKVGNSSDLSLTISNLLNDKNAIKLMGMKARQILETKYNPDKYYTDTMNVFKSLINSKTTQ